MQQTVTPPEQLHQHHSSNYTRQQQPPPQPQRSASFRYDAASAMERMRTSMMGSSNLQLLPTTTTTTATDTCTETRKASATRKVECNDRDSIHQTQRPCVMEQLGKAASQIPAIALIGMFHLMIGIPFGVSYFPMEWSEMGSHDTSASEDDNVHGSFPVQGKEALGIRMFLLSTLLGQIIFTLKSGFANPIGLQMVENVPFCHALAHVVVRRQGYGTEALSTLLFLFGLSSIIVGIVFMVLGQLNLGRIVYYFPNHVLVGCIAGIGVFLAKTGIEVTIDAVFTQAWDNFHLVVVVLVLEIVLRTLNGALRDREGKPLYTLLSPIYFCLVTPMFYIGLWILNVSVADATKAGYFFPSLQGAGNESSSIWNEELVTMWTVIDLRTISWPAVVDSIPTLVALTLFSLIHVPINIPAFALTTSKKSLTLYHQTASPVYSHPRVNLTIDTEVDMNRELIAHGYSNLLSGSVGGLQNYMAYTQSVIYDKSGGTGKASGFAVAVVTLLLYIVGPTVASYIPRCMAGTLLLHVGIDLFLEGIVDSYSKFDRLEYGGVLLIIVVMTLYGMDAAMIAGVLTAIFTFVAQNMTYVDPVRGSMSAATLRSDRRNRNRKARAILDDPSIGRSKILVIQLQGHLFFGNMAHLTKSINELLTARFRTIDQPLIVIIDFSLVLGIDSSAAQAVTKIKTFVRNQFDVKLSIFVTGSQTGFPCAFDLSKELAAHPATPHRHHHFAEETTGLLDLPRVSSHDEVQAMLYCGSHISEDLNMALTYAENSLIARVDPNLLDDNPIVDTAALKKGSSIVDENEVALTYLVNLCGADKLLVEQLFSRYEREVYMKGEMIWKQGSPSTSVKLLVRGMLISELENEAGTSELVSPGNSIGELGFVEGVGRMSSVKCISTDAIVYSLSRESYEILLETAPRAARLIDLICIRYLSARVQHVSNRIFETRCLPI